MANAVAFFRTSIRVNNVLDLCLVDDPASDAMAFREFIPAYVAPEILDKKVVEEAEEGRTPIRH